MVSDTAHVYRFLELHSSNPSNCQRKINPDCIHDKTQYQSLTSHLFFLDQGPRFLMLNSSYSCVGPDVEYLSHGIAILLFPWISGSNF